MNIIRRPGNSTPSAPLNLLPLPGTFYPVSVILGFVLFDAGNILDAEARVNQKRDIGDLFSKVGGLLTITDYWMVGNDVWIRFWLESWD